MTASAEDVMEKSVVELCLIHSLALCGSWCNRAVPARAGSCRLQPTRRGGSPHPARAQTRAAHVSNEGSMKLVEFIFFKKKLAIKLKFTQLISVI
jgi:hypothetical protein